MLDLLFCQKPRFVYLKKKHLTETLHCKKCTKEAVVLPTASGMRKLYPTKAWCNSEGMIALKPVGLQSDCKSAMLMNRGMWLDLRHKMFVINIP